MSNRRVNLREELAKEFIDDVTSKVDYIFGKGSVGYAANKMDGAIKKAQAVREAFNAAVVKSRAVLEEILTKETDIERINRIGLEGSGKKGGPPMITRTDRITEDYDSPRNGGKKKPTRKILRGGRKRNKRRTLYKL
uniref:Uncharacterized protein n=1 Tax=viral metagenome TaxID=1070528 RepID=A0A6C0LA62_9ZZZZ